MTRLLFIFICITTVCFGQNYPDPVITVNNTTKEIEVTVKREPGGKHPILTIDGFLDPCGTFFTIKNDSQFVASFKLVYAQLDPDTIVIKAKDFLEKGGTIADVGTSSAGNIGPFVESIGIVGFYNTGDWMKYTINLTGKKKIKLRYSYQGTATDRKLEIRKDSLTGTLVSEMPARPTGNWNTFMDHVIDILIDTKSTGSVDLFFVVSGPQLASAYWGNLDLITIY